MNDLLNGLWLSLKISGCIVGVIFCLWFIWAILWAWVDMRSQQKRKTKIDNEVLFVCKECHVNKFKNN